MNNTTLQLTYLTSIANKLAIGDVDNITNINSKINHLEFAIKEYLNNNKAKMYRKSIVKILNITVVSDCGELAILEFKDQESLYIWNYLSPYLHNGICYSSKALDAWINVAYPNYKPKYYGIYQIRGY